jgi:F-type H+-transporting ATPase subunit delta
MHDNTHYSPAAASYARAMLEMSDEDKSINPEAIATDLRGLRELVEQNDTFRQYLADPSVSSESRGEVLKRTLASQVSTIVLRTLGVLNEKNRLPLLPQIANAYDDLLDERLGKIEVDLIVAQKLSPEQLTEATQRIGQALKRDAVVHTYVDESIIGGMIVRVGDKLIDASVKNQLQSIKEKLLAAKPK